MRQWVEVGRIFRMEERGRIALNTASRSMDVNASEGWRKKGAW